MTPTVAEPDADLAAHTWRGNVLIGGAAESIAARFFRAAMSLVWREAGW